MLKSKGRVPAPIIFGIRPDGNYLPIIFDTGTDAPEEALKLAREALKREQAVKYGCLIQTNWRPYDLNDREEQLEIFVCDEGSRFCIAFDIKRDDNDKPYVNPKPAWTTDDGGESEFAGMFTELLHEAGAMRDRVQPQN